MKVSRIFLSAARILLLLVLAAIFVNWQLTRLPFNAAYALRSASSCTLYSIQPYPEPNPGDQTFYRYKVLGQAVLNPAQTTIATGAFLAAVPSPSLNPLSSLGGTFCFNPRHALRIVSKGHTFDFLLCYECQKLSVYEDQVELDTIPASGSPQALNDLLTALHLPVAPSP